ncbi:ABC transporter permease [Methanolobus profundi]|uniref:Putative ABC transport system permease protein n=1 Tax=Methanolobus profundi TaxID=487685 RepID=A0A1I4TU20_9EURY|nr:ABC transporter permease [Methanolobus profundi]SFM80266.1 putative ABC transport system permease protein [Methanolobus profundi]
MKLTEKVPAFLRNNMYAELAKRNLKRQSVRTILAAIGIIIGVIAISSMGILGNSLKLSVTDSFADIGDKLIVSPAPGEDYVTDRQVDQINKVGNIESVIPVIADGEMIEHRKDGIDILLYVSVYDIEKDDLEKLVELEEGRYFKPGSTDCVVGSSVAENLEITPGQKIEIDDTKLRVVGILKERGLGFDINTDSGVFTSSEMYEKLYPDEDEGYDQVIVIVEDIEEIDKVVDEIEERINKKDELVTVFATNSITESLDDVFSSISLFLMGIGSISLLVAGVSILNVMLMSTMERTKEIGIMKAVGASRKDILKMFLLEALFLGVIASTAGAILTIGGSYLVMVLVVKNTSYLLTLSSMFYVMEGFFFGIATSLVGGMYPAWKASRMKPLDALRYE